MLGEIIDPKSALFQADTAGDSQGIIVKNQKLTKKQKIEEGHKLNK